MEFEYKITYFPDNENRCCEIEFYFPDNGSRKLHPYLEGFTAEIAGKHIDVNRTNWIETNSNEDKWYCYTKILCPVELGTWEEFDVFIKAEMDAFKSKLKGYWIDKQNLAEGRPNTILGRFDLNEDDSAPL